MLISRPGSNTVLSRSSPGDPIGDPDQEYFVDGTTDELITDLVTDLAQKCTAAAEQEARKRPEVLRLMTHPGVGPITALAFVLVLGSPDRFGCSHQIGSYLGLIPCEDSSANRQRLGHITKQGSSLLRFLLVEAAQAAVRWDPGWRRRFVHLAMRREPSHRQGCDGTQTGRQPLLDVA